MAFRILAALLSIFVLAGIAIRNTPECREPIDIGTAIDIAFAQVPNFTSAAHKIVFESEPFTSKRIKKEKGENGWVVSSHKSDDFEGYFIRFDYKNEKYEGIALFDITNCGKIKLKETGAWLIRPSN